MIQPVVWFFAVSFPRHKWHANFSAIHREYSGVFHWSFGGWEKEICTSKYIAEKKIKTFNSKSQQIMLNWGKLEKNPRTWVHLNDEYTLMETQ